MKSGSLCGGLLRCFRRANLGWLLALGTYAWSAETFDSIFISEALVEHRRGTAATAGKDHGWIELHNGGSGAVNLDGWFLSDTPTNLTKWRFPRVVMLPNSYLLVAASGTGSTNDLADLHANFSLERNGGQVMLAGRATNLVSQIVYPKAVTGVSYGSVRGEPSLRGNFVQPTPGKANQSKGTGFAPPVVFSRPGGSFTSPIGVDLSCVPSSDLRNLVIRYTMDGSLPNSGSPVYAEPLQITNTASVRARAYQEGLLPGPP